MSEKVEKQPDPAMIEIDVVGYRHDFNRASTVRSLDHLTIKITLRELNANQISTLDRRDPNRDANDYRAAKTRITMENGEVLYTPRSVEDINKLIGKAVNSPDRIARCYVKREEVLGTRFTAAEDYLLFADFESVKDGVEGAEDLTWIMPEEIQREFVRGDRQP